MSARGSGRPDGRVSMTGGAGQERVAGGSSTPSGDNVGLDHLHPTVKVHQEGIDRSAGPTGLSGNTQQVCLDLPCLLRQRRSS